MMTLTLTPTTEARLLALAQRRGQTPEAVIDAVIEREAETEPSSLAFSPPLMAQTDPTLALFAKWAEEDKTDDPEEIARRQREGDELLDALQKNRLSLRRVDVSGGGLGLMPALLQPTAIVLDETPLSLLAQKVGHAQGDVCKSWYASLVQAGNRFYVPEIADFELRRELLRAGKTASVTRLNAFVSAVPDRYLPLTTPAVRLAAALWAQAQNQGRMTAPPEALDGDTLIAAQANLLNPAAFGLAAMIVATANVGHLSALTSAAFWSDITP